MADEQNVVHSHLIGLGRGRNGFFCPESRFHLMGGVKPQAEWPAAAPLTQAVIVGLRAGSLRDIRRTIPAELLLSKKELRKLAEAGATVVLNPSEDDDFIMDDDDDKTGGPAGEGNQDGNGNDDGKDDDKEDGNAPDGDKLTEEQIEASSKKDLLAFIKKHEIDMEVLDLNSRSNEAEIKDALKIHFGYKMV